MNDAEKVHALQVESMEAMETLAVAVGYESWIDSDGHEWPAGACWGAHDLTSAAAFAAEVIAGLRGNTVVDLTEERDALRAQGEAMCAEWRVDIASVIDQLGRPDEVGWTARNIGARLIEHAYLPPVAPSPGMTLGQCPTCGDAGDVWDDLALDLRVRTRALHHLALEGWPGPDGQDYIDRERLIDAAIARAYEDEQDGEPMPTRMTSIAPSPDPERAET